MCGRYHLTAPSDQIASLFQLSIVPEGTEPNYNISPNQSVAVARQHPHRGSQLDHLRWGLLPHWMDEPLRGPLLINARQESAHEKPAFRTALERRRCLIPATGFYEWQRVGAARVPYRIDFLNHPLFAFAGLWERWQPLGHKPIDSVAILTTQAPSPLASIHARMPVMLPPGAFATWMNPRVQGRATLAPLLKTPASDLFTATRVSDRVNNAVHNDAECLAPATGPGPLFSSS